MVLTDIKLNFHCEKRLLNILNKLHEVVVTFKLKIKAILFIHYTL